MDTFPSPDQNVFFLLHFFVRIYLKTKQLVFTDKGLNSP